jgi:NAD(P)-dependent dehydrogenase (short-subunit alcohol dehydrogenase family)
MSNNSNPVVPGNFSLETKVAIVTGAGGRGNSIGRAYAFALAAAGAKVAVADLNVQGAQSVAAEITAAGYEAIAIGADITDRDSVDAMTASVASTFGGIDILVNNAALMAELAYTPACQVSLDEWNRVMNVNVTGALNCSQSVIPYMQQRGGGKIVNQTSAGAYPANSVYGISKIALVGLTTTLATELGKSGINVNAIAPGNTQSDAGKASSPESFLQYLDMVCVMRPQGQPSDLTGALLLLCSEAGSWMTGQVLHVDGGWILRP